MFRLLKFGIGVPFMDCLYGLRLVHVRNASGWDNDTTVSLSLILARHLFE
jgi:hypothetical protein